MRQLNATAEERGTRPYRSAINKLIDRNPSQTPISYWRSCIENEVRPVFKKFRKSMLTGLSLIKKKNDGFF